MDVGGPRHIFAMLLYLPKSVLRYSAGVGCGQQRLSSPTPPPSFCTTISWSHNLYHTIIHSHSVRNNTKIRH